VKDGNEEELQLMKIGAYEKHPQIQMY